MRFLQKTEFWTIATLIAVAALLRFWNFGQLGLTHFDEGSYAMTGKWLATLGREGWIYQSGHAPGLFPTVVGLFFILFGIRDVVAIAVSAVAGTLTVGLTYWIGRSWFGVRAGVLAALFLATAEYHLIYSRLALTDALFTLLFWASIHSFYRAFETGERRWSLITGLATGLTWITKYHGFAPLLITGAWLLLERGLRRENGFGSAARRQVVRGYVVSALLAFLVFLPWFVFVQATVGYGEILRNQMAHSFARGTWIVTSPQTLGFYLNRWLSPPLLVFTVGGLLVSGILGGSGGRLLLLASTLFLSSALFYASFPRLVLPVVPGFCLLSACAFATLEPRLRRGSTLMLALGAATILIWNLIGARAVLALRTDGYRRAAAYLNRLHEPLITQMSKNYYFYEETQSFEMRRHDVAMLDSLVLDTGKVAVAFDPILLRLPEAMAWVGRHRPRLQLVREFPLNLYEPLYYQGIDPTQNLENLPRSVAPFLPGRARIEVYRLSAE